MIKFFNQYLLALLKKSLDFIFPFIEAKHRPINPAKKYESIRRQIAEKRTNHPVTRKELLFPIIELNFVDNSDKMLRISIAIKLGRKIRGFFTKDFPDSFKL